MKVAGFTFIRNAIINDYPICEAIQSILPICDEFVVAVGDSEDGTRNMIKGIGSDKIKIIDTVWDKSLRAGGEVFARETDKAFSHISMDVDWAFYIQGDECVHEEDLPKIYESMTAARFDRRIEGLLFHYKHFYGSYDYLAESRRWYRREIRIVRRSLNIHSYKDAQGFRIDGRKIHAKLIDAHINHYGWVKPPRGLLKKKQNFNIFYDKDATIESIPDSASFDYGNADRLVHFDGTHPLIMQKRINAVNWKFDFDPTKIKRKMNFRRRFLEKVHDLTGVMIGEYKNYKIVK